MDVYSTSDLMAKSNKTKRYWLGLVTNVYAFFLVCQGIWTYINYLFIYPAIYFMIPGYDYKWIYTEMYFTQALVLITPIAGGLILMGVGYWLMFREGKAKKHWASIILLVYSAILLFQALWVLFGYAHFWNEIFSYASTNIFTNFPRFFLLLGAVIPPLIGALLFVAVGLYPLGAKTPESPKTVLVP